MTVPIRVMLFYDHRARRNWIYIYFENIDLSGKLNENKELENLEAEAYQLGNLMFRKWTETYKK